LELPIFDQGQGAIGRLAAQYRQAQRALEASAVNIRSEVRQARDLMIANRDLAQYYGKVLLPLRRQIVSQTQLQYNAMQKGTYDLLNAKELELEAERDYVQTWRDYWIARTDLERAVGGRLLLERTTSEGIPAAQKPSTAEKTKAGDSHQHTPKD
jgi:outer membrane protein, heavy metal efflux system